MLSKRHEFQLCQLIVHTRLVLTNLLVDHFNESFVFYCLLRLSNRDRQHLVRDRLILHLVVDQLGFQGETKNRQLLLASRESLLFCDCPLLLFNQHFFLS